MFRKALLLLSAATFISLNVNAQNKLCGTDAVNNDLKKKYPQIAIAEEKIEQEIAEMLSKGYFVKKFAKSSSDIDTGRLYGRDTFDIPIVVHVIHDYGNEYLSDDDIFDAVSDWNDTYNKRYSDTSDVIAPFKKFIGNARINLRLATKDPNGNPTKGITRRQTHLTSNAGDFAKMDGWPNSAYLNLWLVRTFAPEHSGAGAYAYYPSSGQQLPWYDGVICLAQQFNSFRSMEHEIGHCLNLSHVWGNTNDPAVACGDDGVDDTPPTKGHDAGGCSSANLYDTTCSRGYLKIYPSSTPGLDSLVDYPDTNNSQNIMDYTFCAKMFSKGQVDRMHAALMSNTAGRKNLWDSTNLIATGALKSRLDLAPIADFSVERAKSPSNVPSTVDRAYFMCMNTDSFIFKNQSWNDTISSVSWEFSNGAKYPTLSGMGEVKNQFSQPGWVDIKLTANSNAGSSSVTKQVYLADKDYKISPITNSAIYYQEFVPGQGDLDKWPSFNYFNNYWRWQLNSNTGYYDKNCIMYRTYDTRPYPQNLLDNPEKDFDDLFTPAFDLSNMPANTNCNMNFMYASTALSAFTYDLRDTLLISFSIDCGRTWQTVDVLEGQELVNNGNFTSYYEPGWMGEWSLRSINIPNAARVNGVFFRFRYRPGVSAGNDPTGNNFYMDRFNITNFPLGANTMIAEERNIVVAPNPTQGSSTIIIKGDANSVANVAVTDITGKLVYQTQQKIGSGYSTIEIPANAISVKGIYMVQVITDNQSRTEKLVVY
jgi:hypothetical protein